jgi:hypothetical protein
MEIAEWKRAMDSLAIKYNKDLDASEFCLEVESFKHQTQNLLPHVDQQ